MAEGTPQIVVPNPGLIPTWALQRARDVFFEVLSWVPLAASGSSARSFTVDADADLILTDLRAMVTDDAAVGTRVDPAPILVTILSTGSGRQSMNASGHINTIYGTGERPAPLPMGLVIPRSSVVTVTLENLDAANGFDVRLTHTGVKVFTVPDQGPPRG